MYAGPDGAEQSLSKLRVVRRLKKLLPLDKDGITYIGNKDVALLRNFISDLRMHGTRHVSEVLATAIGQPAVKNAIEVALLPYRAKGTP
jgi:ribosomal protein S18